MLTYTRGSREGSILEHYCRYDAPVDETVRFGWEHLWKVSGVPISEKIRKWLCLGVSGISDPLLTFRKVGNLTCSIPDIEWVGLARDHFTRVLNR